ncbi:STAS domain-containing protein [Streptomyces candidus]|uniref:Anti-sigma factor antagonist n=1 Tax=Streptomyces candidus TaxID=67283 RepID=A0A7X0LQ97_9ACTN|nr:STAS domain-containing protein [Streptomyces candidus]MBB6436259.1 anti-anti-sigma factor [Streptomyces candidus]GHH48311.1 anti-sigma factor antagonist [Streptomyces candidus]
MSRDRGLDNELTVDVTEGPAGVVLAIGGDLDFDNSPELRSVIGRLALSPGRLLVLDLSGLTFFDSSGITMLVIARKVALAAGADVAVSGVGPMVAKIFHITGLDMVFRSYPDPSAAFAAAAQN